jgi:hypothetical protein
MVEAGGTLSDKIGNGAGEYDGWFNKAGYAQTWGKDAFINVKYCEAQWKDNQVYTICDMGGDAGAAAPVEGDQVTARWALVANNKTVYVNFNVTFVGTPVNFLADYTPKAETVELQIGAQDANGTWKDASETDAINLADITALVGENYTVYGVGAKVDDKETITNSYSCTPYPGFWCLADGTADIWANGTFGVSFVPDATTGVFQAWTKAAVTEELSTTFYFVNEETKEYVAYKVILLSAPVGINAIEIAKAKGNGKYLDKKGHIIIVNDKKAFSLSGAEMK